MYNNNTVPVGAQQTQSTERQRTLNNVLIYLNVGFWLRPTNQARQTNDFSVTNHIQTNYTVLWKKANYLFL